MSWRDRNWEYHKAETHGDMRNFGARQRARMDEAEKQRQVRAVRFPEGIRIKALTAKVPS